MNPNPPHHQPDGDDNAFLSSLQRLTLRPPPESWREAILSAAAVRTSVSSRIRWYRSPFWRSMAALWVAALLMTADTWRMAPEPQTASSARVPGPFDTAEYHSLLASLNRLQSPRSVRH